MVAILQSSIIIYTMESQRSFEYIYIYQTSIYQTSIYQTKSNMAIEEAEGPFPWPMPLGRTRVSNGLAIRDVRHGMVSSPPVSVGAPSIPGWLEKLPLELQRNTRLLDIAMEASTMPCIEFELPPHNFSAGRILEHCVKTIDRMYTKWKPVIFKVGWTHNPCFRWGNSLYGYVNEREKWTNMCVLHISHEPYSTAMLEAALIQHFKCILVGNFVLLFLLVQILKCVTQQCQNPGRCFQHIFFGK